ncbi:MAG TPA: hypothetical protein VJU54_13245 [Nitrospiraceae bacterium]|nr:hypothetical protein [Nitrospiraceae bacterium]
MNTTPSIRTGVLSDSEIGTTNYRNGGVWFLAVLVCGVGLSGCSSTYEATKTPRTPTEQLLITQSLQRTLIDADVPISPGQTVAVETVGLTTDQAFVTAFIEKWLSREGLNLPKDGKESLVARVTLDAFGTLQDFTFFGIPQITAALLVIPEIAFYKVQKQLGMTRLSIDFIEKKTGRLIRSTPLYEGDAYYNKYTVLVFVNFSDTDLLPPPP